MERRGGDGRPRKSHGLDDHLRRQHARAAHLHHHVEHAALLLLWRVLEGHRPAGRLGRAAEGLALGQGVDLDDRAVHVIGQLVPVLAQPLDALHTVADGIVLLIRHDGKAHGLHGVQGLGVAGVAAVRAVLHVEADDIQLAGGRHLGVELAHGARRRVAGIGEKLLAVDLPLGVELLKDGLGHIDLTADDEALRRVLDAKRQRAHRAEILRHVLADHAVAPGRAADEDAVFILEGHGEPVDLRLDRVAVAGGKQAVHAFTESIELIEGEDVCQALQRNLVPYLLKLAQGLAADALRGRIGRDELGVLRLKGFEPVHQHVVFIIGDDRRVVHIIELAVMFDLPAKAEDLFLCVHKARPLSIADSNRFPAPCRRSPCRRS